MITDHFFLFFMLQKHRGSRKKESIKINGFVIRTLIIKTKNLTSVAKP